MEQTILISALVVLIQLSDASLRHLTFLSEITGKDSIRLWLYLSGWSVVSFGIYFAIFENHGINAANYKAVLMLGWIPYLAIFIYIVGGEIFRHIFVFNMSALWSFMEHSLSALIVINFFIDGKSDAEIITIHAAIYVVDFIVMFPLEKYLFTRLLPPKEFFTTRLQGIYMAFLPSVLLMAHIIRLADNVLVHSTEERLSRIYLPIVFIFLYRYVLRATKFFYRNQNLEKINQRLQGKLFALKEYNKFMAERQEKVSVMRHDLRHSYRLIYTLLNEGNVEKAREYIATQKIFLESSTVRPFCKSALINTVLSIFLSRAEQDGIEIFRRIDIPEKFNTNENDMALLLTNLFENAISSSIHQVKDDKKISVIILHVDGQFVLEISNIRKEKIIFDADGYPSDFDKEFGAGIGVLKHFMEKYDAYADFSQLNEQVRFLMYWSD